MTPLYVCPCNATCKETLQVANLRPRIEAILWKAYEPNQSPNMEEVTDQILSLISKHYVSKEKVREEIERNIEQAEQSYKSAVSDQRAPYRHQLERLLDICSALLSEDRAISK